MLREFFDFWLGRKPESIHVLPVAHHSTSFSIVPIYEEGSVPNLDGFEEMSGYATDAYGTGDFYEGFSEDAKELAVRTVARHYGISNQEAIDQFEICIVPAFSYLGKIMAKRKVVN